MKRAILIEVAPYWNVNDGDNTNGVILYTIEVAPYWNVNYKYRLKYIEKN